MKRILSLISLSILTIALVPSVAFAAKPVDTGGSKPPATTPELVGYDIVGVNGGTAATTNSCLSTQLAWAKGSKTGSVQPKVQLYVNTANPGEVISQITTWPTSNVDKTGFTTANPYGSCIGGNDQACSWQYGWNRSVEANLDRFAPAAAKAGINQSASAYTWWLDVETMNTWQSGSTDALARNTAALEGFAAYYQSKGATVGLYSTGAQWSAITGNSVSSTSNLNRLGNWRPSGASTSSKTSTKTTPVYSPR
jgi:hypothetical protein